MIEQQEKDSFGYQWVRKSTGEFYRGIHAGDPEDNYAGSGTVFVSKFGGRRKTECKNSDDWVRAVLFLGTYDECLLWESLVVTERELANPKCLNKCLGGMSGSTGYKHTESAKRRISESQTGELNPNYGKPMSEETKRKLSKAKTGKKQTLETKLKRVKSLTGLKRTEESKERMSEAQKKRCLEETKEDRVMRSERMKKVWAKRKEKAAGDIA
jgi:hypothetical protein